MLERVPTVKHTRPGVYCINMCVQPALQQASLLATQRLNVGPRVKNFQKTIEFGWSYKYDHPKTKNKSGLLVCCVKG